MFSPLQIAQVSFQLKNEIGAEGKNSKTYIARDHQLDADIVIKKIDKTDIQHRDTYFEESRRLYASAHPHVVQLHYACESDEHVFLAMPFYPNGSLKSLISKRLLTVREIVTLGCQIASGLHNIHSKGLIHFDLKADNVMLSDRNEALISDFGLAMAQDAAGQASPDGIYTPITPPEALSGNNFDRSFDIYQFGLVLYVMCNGGDCLNDQIDKFVAHDGSFDAGAFSSSIENGTFPDRKAFLPHIPPRLRKIVCRCLEVDAANRLGSALEVANELAVVDGLSLDWQYSTDAGNRIWTRESGGMVHVLAVDGKGRSELTKSINGGKAKRQTYGCRPKLTDAAITVLLGKT
jgi:serine/threonine protein kinase